MMKILHVHAAPFKLHGSGKDGLVTLKAEYERKGRKIPSSMPIGESKYYNYLIGYNSRLDAIQAAILRKKLVYLDEFIAGRRKNAIRYNNDLSEHSYQIPFEPEHSMHSYYVYVLKHKDASEIIAKLKKSDIQCGEYYPDTVTLAGSICRIRI